MSGLLEAPVGSDCVVGLRGLEPATRPLSAPAGKFRIRRAQTRHLVPAHFKLEGGNAEQGRPFSLCEQPHRARRLTIVNACSLYVLASEDLP
jgi:hypothetical protein